MRIVDTTVRLVKRVSLAHVAESDATVARDLLNMTATNLKHAEDHMLLLGRKTSLERVAAFLLEMDHRLTAAGVMALPMCRRISVIISDLRWKQSRGCFRSLTARVCSDFPAPD